MIYLDVYEIIDDAEANLEGEVYLNIGKDLSETSCELTILYFANEIDSSDTKSFVLIPSFEEYTLEIEMALSALKLKYNFKIKEYIDIETLTDQCHGCVYSKLKKSTYEEHITANTKEEA